MNDSVSGKKLVESPLPAPIWQVNRFDVLKLRFEDQVALLRKLTEVDLQVFGGYLTVSLAFGSWVSQNPIKDHLSILGLIIISLVLAISSTTLLLFNFKRRVEIVATIKNINTALGYDTVGAFVEGKTLNAPTIFRPWRHIYFLCIWSVFCGLLLVLLGPLRAV